MFAIGEAAMRVRSHLNRSGTRADRLSQVVVVVGVVGSLLAGFGFGSTRATAITAWQWPLFVAGLLLVMTGILYAAPRRRLFPGLW